MTTADGTVLGATKILDNGGFPRYNIVVLGDGYRASEMDLYAQHVRDFVDAFLKLAPLNRLKRAINVWRVDVTSTDSGADDPVTATAAGKVVQCGGSGTTGAPTSTPPSAGAACPDW
jgi:IgA Peptidase M64